MPLTDKKISENAWAILSGYLSKSSLPHALMFCGPENSGQKETAIELAKVLFCEKQKFTESCGVCLHCRQLSQGLHPDFIFLGRSEDSMEIKIGAVREVIARINLKPFQARAKVVYVDPAEAMNDNAQNAFLKTLEEPGGNTYIILASHANEKVLPTVRSRVQRLQFKSVEAPEDRDPEVENARKQALDYLCGREGGARMPDLASLERDQWIQVMELLARGFRDMLVMSSGATETLGIIEDRLMKERALKNFSQAKLLDTIEAISEFKEKAGSSANLKLLSVVFWESLKSKINS